MLSQDVNLGQPSPAHLDETRHSQFAIPDGFTPVEVLDLLQKKHVIIPHSSSQSAPFRESLRSVGYRQSHVTNVKGEIEITLILLHTDIQLCRLHITDRKTRPHSYREEVFLGSARNGSREASTSATLPPSNESSTCKGR